MIASLNRIFIMETQWKQLGAVKWTLGYMGDVLLGSKELNLSCRSKRGYLQCADLMVSWLDP